MALGNISVSKRRGRWCVDYRLNGKRMRSSFDTESLAMAQKLRLINTLGTFNGSQKISIKSAIQRFTDFKAEARRDDRTSTIRKDHRQHFKPLQDFLNDNRILELEHITTYHLDQLKVSMMKRGLSGSTINRFFTTYKSFFNQLKKWKAIYESPAQDVSKADETPQEMTMWSVEEIEAVRAQLQLNARLVFEFIIWTGSRPIDVARLTWGDVDFEKSMVRFTSKKGGRTRTQWSPVGHNALHTLRESWNYLNAKGKAKPHHYAFLSGRGGRVTSTWLGSHVRNSRRELGMNEALSTYGLRHTFIDTLVSANVNLRDVKALARHTKIETTLRYTHRNQAALLLIANAYSPGMNKLQKKNEDE